jgi:hypothetical protein
MLRLAFILALAAGNTLAQQPPLPAVQLGAGMHLIRAEVADMQVSLVNDGPVTLMVEREAGGEG